MMTTKDLIEYLSAFDPTARVMRRILFEVQDKLVEVGVTEWEFHDTMSDGPVVIVPGDKHEAHQ